MKASTPTRWLTSLGFASLCIAALLAPALAAAEEPTDHSAARKLGRGLAGMTLGFLEVPGNVVQETRTNGPGYGLTIGFAMGLGKLVVRELTGVYEFVTAPFELPADFQPVLQPEFPWDYFESAPGRTYGFSDSYLDAEARSVAAVTGAVVERRQGALHVRFPDDLLFATGSARLSERARQRLDGLARVLKEHDETDVFVKGYTDATGPDAVNARLSEARARAVRDHLIARGVAADRISSGGFGPVAPVASNDSAAGRRSNRRVEVEVRAGSVAAYR